MPVSSILSSASQGALGQQSYRRLEQGLPRNLDVVPPPGQDVAPAEAPGRPLKPEFLDLVKGFVGGVNEHQLMAGRAIDAFAAGEISDVHQVMVAVEEAGLAMDLLLEIRNRTVEAFQEIMRLQV